MRIGVGKRLELLFDGGAYKTARFTSPVTDPLKFKDIKRYSDRLKDSQSKTSEEDALIVAHGKMGGQNVVIAAFNFAFMGGSMGTAVGEGILTAIPKRSTSVAYVHFWRCRRKKAVCAESVPYHTFP